MRLRSVLGAHGLQRLLHRPERLLLLERWLRATFKRGRMSTSRLQSQITTNGTGATSVNASLPVTPKAANVFAGRETVVGGKTLTGTVTGGSTTMQILNYDNTYPGSNGCQLVLAGVYEASIGTTHAIDKSGTQGHRSETIYASRCTRGKNNPQAVAIALDVARRAKRSMASGGNATQAPWYVRHEAENMMRGPKIGGTGIAPININPQSCHNDSGCASA